MADMDNMEALAAPFLRPYDSPHSPSDFASPGLHHPSDSACDAASILQYPCVRSAVPGNEFGATTSAYPSPPPTNAQLKHSVPLPRILGTPYAARSVGGILDSPLVMHHEALTPLSPPPTLPTSTLALPDADGDFSSDDHDDRAHTPQAVDASQPDAPDDDFVGVAIPDPLLSPLSPEWNSNKIEDTSPPAGDCVLLSEAKISREDPVPGPSYQRRREAAPLLDTDDVAMSPSSHNYSISWWESPDAQLPLTEDASPRRPLLHSLDIPSAYDGDDKAGWSMEEDYDENLMDVDPSEEDDDSVEPHPSPPLPDLFDWEEVDQPPPQLQYDYDTDDPSSPFRKLSPLPELDEISHPSSPSRRSFSSLPDLEMGDAAIHSPSSPSLISLPGVEPDDDLISADLALPAFEPPELRTASSNRSLLLLDDPNDVPAPRSPSPEPFELDPALLAAADADPTADPDLHRLCALRRRLHTVERELKQTEVRLLEQGALHARGEVRARRKAEKERGREVAALLRLKLGAGAAMGSPSPKKGFGSLSQLVARMLFRRGERFRPLMERRIPALAPATCTRSPLSRPAWVLSDAGSSGEEMDV